jgi:hypothetical protein
LIRITRPDGDLTLVDKNFTAEWSGRFDPTQPWYAYSGRGAGTESDAVYVRDLQNHSERVLVPSLGDRSFSLPNFWGADVVFVRSNRLWQVSVTGGEPEQLFPPPHPAR